MAASWPETKPLSEENLSDLVDIITQAEANIEAGKGVIASAITDMNQPASPTEPHAQLAAKIRDISKDADAEVGQVLTGRTFYQGGQRRTGTMPNRGNVAATLTQQGQEYTVPAGHHAGAGKVKAQFANLTPPNILNTVNVGGVVGTAKREVSGEATANASGVITVTGIPWINQRTHILIRGARLSYPNLVYRQIARHGMGHGPLNYRMLQGIRNIDDPETSGSYSVINLPTPLTVNDGVGFTCPGFEPGISYSYVVTEG